MWSGNKVLAITTDNGHNIIKAAKDLLAHRFSAAGNTAYVAFRCNAHIVNLICQEHSEVADRPIAIIRSHSKKILGSPKKTTELRELCAAAGEL